MQNDMQSDMQNDMQSDMQNDMHSIQNEMTNKTDIINDRNTNWDINKDINVQHLEDWNSNLFETNDSNTYDKKTDSIMKHFVDSTKQKMWPKSTNIHCYWCCHKFKSRPCALPFRYEKDTYKVYGCFCSPECAAAYNFNDLQDSDLRWERYSLLNMMYKKIYQNSNVKIKLAPPRQCLNIFGGPLTITQFRTTLENYNKTYVLNFPPMTSINIQQEQINFELNNFNKKDLSLFIPVDQDRVLEANENLKLKRKKPVSESKNTLETCMNLQFK